MHCSIGLYSLAYACSQGGDASWMIRRRVWHGYLFEGSCLFRSCDLRFEHRFHLHFQCFARQVSILLSIKEEGVPTRGVKYSIIAFAKVSKCYKFAISNKQPSVWTSSTCFLPLCKNTRLSEFWVYKQTSAKRTKYYSLRTGRSVSEDILIADTSRDYHTQLQNGSRCSL